MKLCSSTPTLPPTPPLCGSQQHEMTQMACQQYTRMRSTLRVFAAAAAAAYLSGSISWHFDDLHCSILLLLEQQHALEDAIDVNLQQLIVLVDGCFGLLAQLNDLVHVGALGGDHDTVCVTVYHLQAGCVSYDEY